MARPDPFIGKVIDGRYELVRKIGAGGFGAVYRAEHVRLESPFALKFLFPMMAQDEQFAARFEREAKTTSRLRHPNIVDVVDFGDEPTLGLFLVMEYLEGESLFHRIKRSGVQSVASIVRIAAQISDAFSTAHEAGVIHRDLKPANIFLLNAGGSCDYVKVLDFGIAGLADDGGKGLTKSGMVMGSPSYMSPEQAWAQKLDHRTDIYSLGVLLYEMATGSRPFRGESDIEIRSKHKDAPLTPPRTFRPDLGIPADLEAVITRCLAKAPGDRYQSMRAVRHALSRLGMGDVVGVDSDLDDGCEPTALVHAAPTPVPDESVSASATPTPGGTTVDPLAPTETRDDGPRRRRLVPIFLAGVTVLAAVVALLALKDGTPAPAAPSSEATVAALAPPMDALPAESVSAAPDVSSPSSADPVQDVAAADTVTDAPATAEAGPAPPPAPVHVVLRSKPSGAKVIRGDGLLCETPCDLSMEAADTDAILRVERSGYYAKSLTVPLRPGSEFDEVVVLKKRRRKPRRVPKATTDRDAPPPIRLDGPKKQAPVDGPPSIRL